MKARAQRHLDGCRVNTDRMAMDVLALADLAERLQQQLHEQRQPAQAAARASGPMAGAIDDILAGAFGKQG
ncbi:hypothetical protein [Azohydromonas aeria]|uniref:hypothetical protein n=1 Tax=Azohydromonas aeria TaxID=2590212 RepID=UPI0012F8B166|nr:hypothetical protein [Azohydromonas aeria]